MRADNNLDKRKKNGKINIGTFELPELPCIDYVLFKRKNSSEKKKNPIKKLPYIINHPDFKAWKETVIIPKTNENLHKYDKCSPNEDLLNFYNKIKKQKTPLFYMQATMLGWDTRANQQFKANDTFALLYAGELKEKKDLHNDQYFLGMDNTFSKEIMAGIINKLEQKNYLNFDVPVEVLNRKLHEVAAADGLSMYKNSGYSSKEFRNHTSFMSNLPSAFKLTAYDYFCHEWLQKNIVTANITTIRTEKHYGCDVQVLRKQKGVEIPESCPVGFDYGFEYNSLETQFSFLFYVKPKKRNQDYTFIHRMPFEKIIHGFLFDDEFNSIWKDMHGLQKVTLIKRILRYIKKSKKLRVKDGVRLSMILAITHVAALKELSPALQAELYEYYQNNQSIVEELEKERCFNFQDYLRNNNVPTIFTELCRFSVGMKLTGTQKKIYKYIQKAKKNQSDKNQSFFKSKSKKESKKSQINKFAGFEKGFLNNKGGLF
jgi:hypothetical protein